MCSSAAISGYDGSLWAKSPTDSTGLATNYLEVEHRRSKISVQVNEVACALCATNNNNRNPCEAVIYFNYVKHHLVNNDAEVMSPSSFLALVEL